MTTLTKAQLITVLENAPDDAPVFLYVPGLIRYASIANVDLDTDEDHAIVIEGEPV